MNTAETLVIGSTSSSATEQLGEQLGRNLKGNEIIELRSDLGGGKTTFVRGLVKGWGSTARVSSPTFTISREYVNGNRKLYHFDFYRLNEPGIIAAELSEALEEEGAVTAIEWGDVVENVLPKDRMVITITTRAHDENAREIQFECPKSWNYLLKNLG